MQLCLKLIVGILRSGSVAGEIYHIRTDDGRPKRHALQNEGEVFKENRLFLADSLFQPSCTLPCESVRHCCVCL